MRRLSLKVKSLTLRGVDGEELRDALDVAGFTEGEEVTLLTRAELEQLEARSVVAAGRRGGARLAETRGRDYFAEIGSRGGRERVAKAGAEGMAEMGRRGGAARLARLGPEGMAEMGRRGGRPRAAAAAATETAK